MKNCHKWMVACVVVAIGLVFLLPKFGVPLAGTALLFPLLMIGCCVVPMLFMMKSSQGKEEGKSCCSPKERKGDQDSKEIAQNEKSSSGSCH